MTTLLQWFVLSDRGQVREANEDSVQTHPDSDILRQRPDYMVPGGRLCIVADGMGGHRGGKQASDIAVKRIGQYYYTTQGEGPEQALRMAIQQTNHDILQVAQNDPSLENMGTTVVLATALDNQAYIANVGDSRAYLWRKGTLKLLSHDDRWVAQQMREGVLTMEQARNHEFRNLLVQYLGNAQGVKAHITQEMLQPEDRLLLCTDGLFEAVSEEEISRILAAPPEQAARRLIKQALANRSSDNITVGVGYYGPLLPIGTSGADPVMQLLNRLSEKLHLSTRMLLIAGTLLLVALILLLFGAVPAVIARVLSQGASSSVAGGIGTTAPPNRGTGSISTPGQARTTSTIGPTATQVTGEGATAQVLPASSETAASPTAAAPAETVSSPSTAEPAVTAIAAEPTATTPTAAAAPRSTEQPTATVPVLPTSTVASSGGGGPGTLPEVLDPGTWLETEGWRYNFDPGRCSDTCAAPTELRFPPQQGRFVYVVVAVANQTGQEQPLPDSLFVLHDAQGRTYPTQPTASREAASVWPAPLTYGVPVPADGQAKEIGLVFDVATDATDLVLVASSQPQQGWRVLDRVE